jgi:sulfite exporter TauE/SafE
MNPMHEAPQLVIYGSLLLAGLVGSLHCIGMCGPILLSFSQVFEDAGRSRRTPRTSFAFDFTWYHAGRIWTYGVLGFVAGWAGHGLRATSEYLGWQRPLSAVLGLIVVFSGLALLGVIPGLRILGGAKGCDVNRVGGPAWLQALLRAPGRLPRLLLGATMGLLPCGLVYAMLAVAATLPTPLHAAAGMFVFGAGTLPSLSAVLLAGRMLPARLRLHGMRLAAVAVIVAGCWMTARTLMSTHVHSMH